MVSDMTKHAPLIKKGAGTLIIGALVLLLVVAGSLSMYFPTRTTQHETTIFGDPDAPDRVNLSAWITKVDPASGVVTVSTEVLGPTGSLADPQGYFNDDTNLYTTSTLQNRAMTIKKEDFFPVVEQRFALTGLVTDYPFDRYTTNLEYHVWGGPDNHELPITVTLFSTDPFFVITPTQGTTPDSGGIDIELSLRRSTPTLVYASFVMILMLGLATAATTAAYYALKRRKGLLFPACSMMAAMLFALVPLRNAVPGSPPIGSVIDFGSFFIAAITIAISLITCVTIGYRVQLVKDREDDDEDDLKLAAYTKYLNSPPHR